MNSTTPQYSRPVPLIAVWIPAVILIAIILIDTSAVDYAIENIFYTPGKGFIGQHSWVLEDFMHERVKEGVILFGIIGAIGLIGTFFREQWRYLRRPLAYFVLASAICASIAPPLKKLTGIQCPWDLKDYGGQYTHTSILEKHPVGEPRGKCWPGGHATTGFSLFTLYFLFRDRRPKIARRVLYGVIIFGSTLAFGRMIQGAHFLSHNMATAAIDWLVCLACYRGILYKKLPNTDSPIDSMPAQ